MAPARPTGHWITAAVLLMGLGSELGTSPGNAPRPTEHRAPLSGDPMGRLVGPLPGSPSDEAAGDPEGSACLPPAGAGPTRLDALDLVGGPPAPGQLVTLLASSPPRAPPGGPAPSVAPFATVPSRFDVSIDPPQRWSGGRGPPRSARAR